MGPRNSCVRMFGFFADNHLQVRAAILTIEREEESRHNVRNWRYQKRPTHTNASCSPKVEKVELARPAS